MLHARPITSQLLVQIMKLVITLLPPLPCHAPQHRYQTHAVSILWQCPVSVPEKLLSVIILCVVGFICLMIRAGGGLLGARKLTLGLNEKWGISPLEENLTNFEDRSHNVLVAVIVVVVLVAAASVM